MRELITVEDFKTCIQNGTEFIVITDIANTNKIHKATCSYVSSDNFMEKVITNNCKNGGYFATTDIERAKTDCDAIRCQRC